MGWRDDRWVLFGNQLVVETKWERKEGRWTTGYGASRFEGRDMHIHICR